MRSSAGWWALSLPSAIDLPVASGGAGGIVRVTPARCCNGFSQEMSTMNTLMHRLTHNLKSDRLPLAAGPALFLLGVSYFNNQMVLFWPMLFFLALVLIGVLLRQFEK